jgi:UDP-glucuronate 4-epimerase
MGAPIGGHDSLSNVAPYRVVNIGGGTPVKLIDFIDEIERCLGVPVKKRFMEMQQGDVPSTFASADLLEQITDYRPSTPVSEGVGRFLAWYRGHYGHPG